MIIYLVSAPGHEITGYGDGLIDGEHPSLLVSYLEYMGAKLRPLRGFNRGRLLTHPCSTRCQYAVDLGLYPEKSCSRTQCHYEEHFPEIMENEARVAKAIGEPDDVNADLLSGA